MAQEAVRLALTDSSNGNLVNVVASVDVPGVYGIVALNPDGSKIGS